MKKKKNETNSNLKITSLRKKRLTEKYVVFSI